MARFTMSSPMPGYLRDLAREVEAHARGFGLDFFPTEFEVVGYAQMNELAAYGGFPSRYPHWRFGMDYDQLQKSQEYGLSRIYEMVINTNPAVAYLLEGNSLVDQKLVMSHVFAHVDFFKNNYCFRATDQGIDEKTGAPVRRWIDTMANHGATLRRWAGRVGLETIEQFVDDCLSLENLIDPARPLLPPKAQAPRAERSLLEGEPEPEVPATAALRVDREYMRDYINPKEFLAAEARRAEAERARETRVPERPERDVLGFLLAHAPLERWEHDVLSAVRAEAQYFWPQMQTKIMNEGWASYWHSRLMTEKVCGDGEIVEYAERNAGVMETSARRLNPYKLGVALYRAIEERWDRGQFGAAWEACDDLAARRAWDLRTGLGREKLFEVRALHNDVTFIDEFLTPEVVFDQKLFAFGFQKRHERWEVESREFRAVKEKLLASLTNAGQPFVRVLDANHANRGELLLGHEHHGVDLRTDWAREVLRSLVRVWRRPVELHTVLGGQRSALRFDGREHAQRLLG